MSAEKLSKSFSYFTSAVSKIKIKTFKLHIMSTSSNIHSNLPQAAEAVTRRYSDKYLF